VVSVFLVRSDAYRIGVADARLDARELGELELVSAVRTMRVLASTKWRHEPRTRAKALGYCRELRRLEPLASRRAPR
jgi:hypothetical protein